MPLARRVRAGAPAGSLSVLLAGSLALSLATLVALPLMAQGTVSGSVHLIERGTKSSKDLDDAVVYLDAEDGASRPANVVEGAVVNMKGREFVPHVQIVRVGGTVAYPNKDPFSHNVFSNSALGAFDLGLYRTGASRSVPFVREGVYAIYCNIHARMVNFVVAVTTPYVARVKADGSFQLRDVPAGTYRLRAWHERATETTQTITVPAAGTGGLSITLDARAYVPAPHPDKFGKPYATTRADRY
jgi:plastocyanin